MDVLTDVLRHLQVRGKAAGELELGAPWSMGIPEMGEAMVHIVSRGSCFLRLGGETWHLGPGDLAFIAHGAAHVLSDDPTRNPVDIETLMQGGLEEECEQKRGCRIMKRGGAGPRTTIICASFLFASGEHHPLLSVLPPLILLRSEDMVTAGWLEDSLRFIAREARSDEPGAQIAIDRLFDLLFVQIVRAWLRTEPSISTGWLGALSHPQVGKALGLIHQEPERDWTVEDLAREVGMSRSGFAAHFSKLVGEPPLRYLVGWRMTLASQRLVGSDVTVGNVAQSLGYRSEAAFGAAFKKQFGVPPGTWRRTELAPVSQA
ncbi:MAG: AraC family transcriptional regulator [Armatimonadetes bacterium]|nr:AraC family transcriptional regulator [Armatimonadota bacterium]